MSGSVVDVLETEFRLKDNYSAKVRAAEAATSSFSGKFDKVARSQMFGSLASGLAMAGAAAIGLTAALGANAMRDSAQFDSLVKGLEAVEGSAERARAKIEELRELAKAPGIGFEQAVVGYGGLRRNGVSDAMSQSLVREAGNANAASGGDVAKFEQIMRAFMQIAAKPKLQGDELLQLNEAGLPIQKMLKEAFGTADPEQLAKAGKSGIDVLEGLMKVMAKMPRVGGGFQNVLDNMADALRRASVEVGDGLNRALLPMLEGFGEEIAKMSENGEFRQLGDELAKLGTEAMNAVGGVVGVTQGIKDMASMSSDFMNATKPLRDYAEFWNKVVRFIPENFMGDLSADGPGEQGQGGNIRDLYDRAARTDKDTAAMEAELKRKKEAKRKAQDEKEKEEAKKDKEEKDKSSEEKKITPAENFLKKIEENTRVLPELTKTILGGGELGRLGVTSRDIKAQRQSRKVAKGIENMAIISAGPMARLSRR